MKLDPFYLSGIERKAAKEVYLKFRINGKELNMLMGLSAYLVLYNRQIVSRKIFTDWLGLNRRAGFKANQYLYGLEIKGAIHRLAYRRPDGYCLSISAYGVKILNHFEQAIKRIEKQDRARKSNLTYKDLIADLNNLPKGYILMHKGREN